MATHSFVTTGRTFQSDFHIPDNWAFLHDLPDWQQAAVKAQVKARFDLYDVEGDDLHDKVIRFELDPADGWAVTSKLFTFSPVGA